MDVVDLAIKMTADASDAADAFDQVGASASTMAADVDAAADKADAATRDLAGGVDDLGSSSSQAAGGLGDLGGALSLMPGPLGAVGGSMESLAPAIMGVTGASDLLKLAMENSALASAKAKAQAVAHTVATKAQAAASKVTAAATWLLNAAMAANPIGLVIAAALILIGLFVLLYKRSDTFRAIVNTIGDVGKKALGFIVDKAKDLSEKFRELVKPLEDNLQPAIELIGTVGETAFNLWLTPLRTVIDLVKQVIEWIGKIKIPDLGALGDLLRVSAGGLAPSTTVPAGFGPKGVGWTQVNVRIDGAVDPVSTARQLRSILGGYGVVLGDVVA